MIVTLPVSTDREVAQEARVLLETGATGERVAVSASEGRVSPGARPRHRHRIVRNLHRETGPATTTRRASRKTNPNIYILIPPLTIKIMQNLFLKIKYTFKKFLANEYNNIDHNF